MWSCEVESSDEVSWNMGKLGWMEKRKGILNRGKPFVSRRPSSEHLLLSGYNSYASQDCFKGMIWLLWSASVLSPGFSWFPSRGKGHRRSGRQRRSLPAGCRPCCVPGVWGRERRSSRGGEESRQRDGPEGLSAAVSGQPQREQGGWGCNVVAVPK